MSLWQTQSWQEMLLSSGQIEEYFVIEQNISSPDSKESGLEMKIFIEKRKVSLGEYGLFVIGLDVAPSLLTGENGERCCVELRENPERCLVESNEYLKRIFENLQKLCIEKNCLFAQIETLNYSFEAASQLPHHNSSPLGEKMKSQIVAPFSSKGERIQDGGCCVEKKQDGGSFVGKYYKKFIPPYTAVIDLIKSEDEILAAMKPKGRYNIKVAQKNAVQVKQVWKTPENVEKFYELMCETTDRGNFSGNNLAYYQKFLEFETALLFFAYHEEKIIAAGIFVQHENTMYYYYGASSNHKRNFMAPYLLQWTVIQHAKELGCTLYDLLGIASPDEVDSPLAGVTDFKLKLTPDSRYVSKSFLYIHKKWKYSIIELLKKSIKK